MCVCVCVCVCVQQKVLTQFKLMLQRNLKERFQIDVIRMLNQPFLDLEDATQSKLDAPTDSLVMCDLNPDVSEMTLYDLASPHGHLASIRVVRQQITRISLGYAFVRFHSVADAQRALQQLHGTSIGGRPCRVYFMSADRHIRPALVAHALADVPAAAGATATAGATAAAMISATTSAVVAAAAAPAPADIVIGGSHVLLAFLGLSAWPQDDDPGSSDLDVFATSTGARVARAMLARERIAFVQPNLLHYTRCEIGGHPIGASPFILWVWLLMTRELCFLFLHCCACACVAHVTLFCFEPLLLCEVGTRWKIGHRMIWLSIN